jgi:D-alanyl-D-alanine carboxypeptidase/D-alanyl-D-alanine-endopeptidase (penicillin-binding protein 4)
VTPETSARLLVSLSGRTVGPVFKDSLPISGRDGTLASRLKTIADKVSAKTGSLTYDNSLSGYLLTSKSGPVAFSIMCNDQTGRANSIRLIDQIVAILAAFPDAPSEKAEEWP